MPIGNSSKPDAGRRYGTSVARESASGNKIHHGPIKGLRGDDIGAQAYSYGLICRTGTSHSPNAAIDVEIPGLLASASVSTSRNVIVLW